MRSITMYNTYFGDCFKLENQNHSLVVDFGIHQSSKLDPKITTENIYESILKEFDSIPPKDRDLLVTHFHHDHISGLLYTRENGSAEHYATMYIPDVFTGPHTPYIALLLLEELLSSIYVGRNKISLCEFCKFLCSDVSNVRPLKRGDHFQEYTALWPDMDTLSIQYRKILKGLHIEDEAFYHDLIDIATSLIEIVVQKTYYGPEYTDNHPLFRKSLQLFDGFQARMETLQKSFALNAEQEELLRASDIGNWASIVFQNTDSGDENLLFTGDIPSKYMAMIALNTSLPVPVDMHTEFCYIKIPHHGTQAHYFDFYGYQPKVFMVPNGLCDNGAAYKISASYLSSATHPKVSRPKMYCSNTNCNAWAEAAKCICGENRCILYRSDALALGNCMCASVVP